MGWNKLVGGFRESVTAVRPHKHLVAVGAIHEKTGRLLAWSAGEVRRGEHAITSFYTGSATPRTAVKLTNGCCAICGADVLQIEPRDVEQRLPECRIGSPRDVPACAS